MSRRRLRVGVIGAGSWAVESHLPAFARHAEVVELVIVNRRDPAHLETIRTRFGFAHASTRWQDVLAERPDIILVSSPAALHYEHARAALDVGAHVLCEKPFTLSAADAWDLARRSAAMGREVVVAFGWNYQPMVIDAERLMIEDGGLGEIEHLSIVMASATRDLLGRPGSSAPPTIASGPESAEGSISSRAETWRDPSLAGGGYGQAQLSHALGLGLRLGGLRGAQLFAYLGESATSGVELHDAIAIRFANGAIGTISGASNHGGDNGKHQLEVRFVGSRGQLLLDLEREALWRYRGPGDDVRVPVQPDAGRYEGSGPVDAIVDLARGRGVNRSPAELGARVTEILEAAYRSAATGAPVTIAEGPRPVDSSMPLAMRSDQIVE
jgi:predicted dehydrogenase